VSPFLITGLAAGAVGVALGFGTAHTIDGRTLAREQAAHQQMVAQINAESAKALSAALAKQQAAESDIAAIQQKFTDEVSKHAQDSLDFRARLSAGTDRVRVRIAGCSASVPGESAASASSSDGPAAYGDIYGPTASGIFKVAADDQAEIDKLSGLQAYVRALQEQGFIASPSDHTGFR
jgi:hypothetical protein